MGRTSSPRDDPGRRYDEVPYTNHCYEVTHPDRLGTLGALYGLDPAPSDQCRVLEVGCGAGGNLLPMALTLPGSEFLGVDASGRAIEAATSRATTLGLTNLELRHARLEDLDASEGPFDYLIAHGVFSWVPRPVQERLLDLCSAVLSPNGVAFVSYDAQPGGYLRGAVRSLALARVQGITSPKMRVLEARALIDFLAENADEGTAWRQVLRDERDLLRRCPDDHVFHDHLNPDHEAVWFEDFAARAGRRGLQYLAEAEPVHMWLDQHPVEVTERIERVARDRLHREHLIDLVGNRLFRQTLLCHQGPTLREPAPEHLVSLFASSRLVPADEPGVFQGRYGRVLVTGDRATEVALRALAERAPADVAVAVLLDRVEAEGGAFDRDSLLDFLLQAWWRNQVELCRRPRPVVLDPGSHPMATGHARLQSAVEPVLTNLRHESVPLDPMQRRLVQLLDGTRVRHDLCTALDLGRDEVDGRLHALARSALLTDREFSSRRARSAPPRS